MKINVSNWKPFRLGKIFKIKYGVNLELNACVVTSGEEGINFVSRTESNNGVSAKVQAIDDVAPQPAGLLSLAGGGSVLSTFYQEDEFYSGRDLYTLEAVDNISKEAKMFLSTIITQNKYKYSYGRQVNKTMPNLELLLPVLLDNKGMPKNDSANKYSDEGFIPDWQFMESYIKSLHYKPVTTKNKRCGHNFSPQIWKEFKVGDFFDIRPTKTIDGLSADDCTGYGVPLVVNSAENNGVAGLCDREATEAGNIITFSDTTDGNTFFYQPGPFIGFAHVQGMYPKTRDWSRYELLFFRTLLTFDSKGRFSYGRKMRRDIISETMIRLPVTPDGTPDWNFMDAYIKSLPYGDRI